MYVYIYTHTYTYTYTHTYGMRASLVHLHIHFTRTMTDGLTRGILLTTRAQTPGENGEWVYRSEIELYDDVAQKDSGLATHVATVDMSFKVSPTTSYVHPTMHAPTFYTRTHACIHTTLTTHHLDDTPQSPYALSDIISL